MQSTGNWQFLQFFGKNCTLQEMKNDVKSYKNEDTFYTFSLILYTNVICTHLHTHLQFTNPNYNGVQNVFNSHVVSFKIPVLKDPYVCER